MEVIYWLGLVLFWLTAMILDASYESKEGCGYDFGEFMVGAMFMLALSVVWPVVIMLLIFVGSLYCLFKLLKLIFKIK